MVKVTFKDKDSENTKEYTLFTRGEAIADYRGHHSDNPDAMPQIASLSQFEDRTNDNFNELPNEIQQERYFLTSYCGLEPALDGLFKRGDVPGSFGSVTGYFVINTTNIGIMEGFLSATDELQEEMYLKHRTCCFGDKENTYWFLQELFRQDMKQQFNLEITDEYRDNDRATEYMLNCVVPFSIHEPRAAQNTANYLFQNEHLIHETAEKIDNTSGPRSTVYEEFIRCIMKVTYRWVNDGDNAMRPSDGNFLAYVNLAAILDELDTVASKEENCADMAQFVSDFMETMNDAHGGNGPGGYPDVKFEPEQYSQVSDYIDILCNEYDGCCAIQAFCLEVALIKLHERRPDLFSEQNYLDTVCDYLGGQWRNYPKRRDSYGW